MNRRQFLATTAVTAAAAAMASKLEVERVEAEKASGKTVVTLMYASGDFTPANKAEFQKLNPDIQIRQIDVNQTTLNAMIAAGSPPDIISAHYYDIPSFVLRNQIQDITSYLQKSSVIKMSDLAPIANAYRWDPKKLAYDTGSYWGLCKDWSQDGTMWYNKALLSAAGLSVPDLSTAPNFNDLISLGEKLTVRQSGAVKVFGLDLAYDWGHAARHFMHLMSTMAKGSSFYSADGTTCDFGSANATTVLQAAVNWGKANIGPGAITADSSGCNTRLINGRSAMIMQGEWIVGPLMTGSTTGGPVSNIADFVLGPAPVLGSYRVSETYFSQGFVMSAGSKVKDAAWKLVEYFFGPKGADERAKIGWGEPGLKSAFQYFPKTGAAAEWYNSTQTEAKYFATMPYSPYASSDDVNSVMLNEIANVILGKETLAQAQANMTSQVNAKLAAGKASLLG